MDETELNTAKYSNSYTRKSYFISLKLVVFQGVRTIEKEGLMVDTSLLSLVILIIF